MLTSVEKDIIMFTCGVDIVDVAKAASAVSDVLSGRERDASGGRVRRRESNSRSWSQEWSPVSSPTPQSQRSLFQTDFEVSERFGKERGVSRCEMRR
jgi:hypothetical protein